MKSQRLKWRLIIFLLIFCLLIIIIGAVSLGAVKIPFPKVISVLGDKFVPQLTASDAGVNKTIIFDIRLPRVLLAGLVGFSLAAAGTVFQALLKNPMADPYVIGISSGASLGAAAAIIFDLKFNLWGLNTIPLFAFGGALLTIIAVYNLAKSGGEIPVTTLLLAGVATGSFLSAIVSLLMVFNNQSMQEIVFWIMGSLAGAGWEKVQMSWFYILLSYGIIHFFAVDLNVMLLGDDSAQSLGIDVALVKKILLVSGSVLAGAAVAVSGVIGFVGLIIPHIVRLVVGPDHRILLPASALIGASFLITTDTCARTIIAPTEIPVGIITALFGAPFFLYLLRKKKGTIF